MAAVEAASMNCTLQAVRCTNPSIACLCGCRLLVFHAGDARQLVLSLPCGRASAQPRHAGCCLSGDLTTAPCTLSLFVMGPWDLALLASQMGVRRFRSAASSVRGPF